MGIAYYSHHFSEEDHAEHNYISPDKTEIKEDTMAEKKLCSCEQIMNTQIKKERLEKAVYESYGWSIDQESNLEHAYRMGHLDAKQDLVELISKHTPD